MKTVAYLVKEFAALTFVIAFALLTIVLGAVAATWAVMRALAEAFFGEAPRAEIETKPVLTTKVNWNVMVNGVRDEKLSKELEGLMRQFSETHIEN